MRVTPNEASKKTQRWFISCWLTAVTSYSMGLLYIGSLEEVMHSENASRREMDIVLLAELAAVLGIFAFSIFLIHKMLEKRNWAKYTFSAVILIFLIVGLSGANLEAGEYKQLSYFTRGTNFVYLFLVLNTLVGLFKKDVREWFKVTEQASPS